MRKTLAFRPAGQFEVTLGSASESFRLRCQAQNLSVGTLGWYKQILKMFSRYLDTQGVTTARAVTPTLIREHLEDMRERGNGTVTVALRHSFAVLYVRNGGDSFSLQAILGHSTLEMTRQYVNLARRDVAEQHKKFSPVASFLQDARAPHPRMVRSSATPLSVPSLATTSQ